MEWERPLPNSYWVVPGKFLAGGHPGSVYAARTRQNLQSLIEAGVTIFIDLTEKGEYHDYSRLAEEEGQRQKRLIACYRVPVEDMTAPTPAQMIEILDIIDTALSAGRTVYVHCQAGIGRTGTVVGCYLVRHGLGGYDALDKLEQLRKGTPDDFMASPHRPPQVDMVLDWLAGQ